VQDYITEEIIMQHEIVPRQTAIHDGLKLYFTGKPCKYGHIDQRYTVSNVCKECHRKLMANYRKKIMEKRRQATTKKEEIETRLQ
jgi:hypothetical protein